MADSKLHAVAMAGGAGTRFWPLSRRARPKQLLTLFGPETLLAATFGRIAGLIDASRHWMVVGASHADACQRAAPHVGAERLLIEPLPRNTAAAIALAAVHVRAVDPQGVLAVFPADHHVRDAAALSEAVRVAGRAAADGAIVTLGIRPTRPETGYGYIQRGDAGPIEGTHRVRHFREKPVAEVAAEYVADGSYDWNAGIFVVRADVYLTELAEHLPDQSRAFERLAEVLGDAHYERELRAVYEGLPSVSVDYGIMEKARDVLVVPTECGWSDVGSLDALRELGDTDGDGNRLVGRALAIDSRRSLVWSDADHAVVVVGVEDVIVAHTRDATLVVPASKAQDVRRAVSRLQELEWDELL